MKAHNFALLLAGAVSAGLTLTPYSTAQQTGTQAAIEKAAEPTVKVQTGGEHQRTPNILFIIMDDVGIDQLKVFGYGGPDVPKTPNIDAVAHGGVRFRNVWAMPECSPSRAIFFEGRLPFRTHVLSALLPGDLANSQVSPFEYTVPKLLSTRGYESGNFGKFHLSQTYNNPAGYQIIRSLGWDYSDGILTGAPYPIDASAGCVTGLDQYGNCPNLSGPYSCGYVPNAKYGGADTGSCHFVNNSCQDLSANSEHPTPGRYCLEEGGVFEPNYTCQETPENPPNFNLANGYYVWYRVIGHSDGTLEQVPLTDPRARGYMAEAQTTAAVDWINLENKKNKPWMATMAYEQIHTPYQQVPTSLVASGSPSLNDLACIGNVADNLVAYHLLSNQMLEAMDIEIGRLLVQTGLATYNADGSLNYQPQKTNTMVVIVGDNGTYAAGVKHPFDPTRAKGFVYQTGVWVPLIVAGPLVSSPDRDVESMVNIADMFQLFGEIAGVDVHKKVPKSHVLDSVSMIPYLTNPQQGSIRQINYTQTGNNYHVNVPPPCVITVLKQPNCVQIFTNPGICIYEGGDWYGPQPPGGTNPVYKSCCDVKKNVAKYANASIVPDTQFAVRDDLYKFVQKDLPDCEVDGYPDVTLNEFYKIDQAEPTPELDKADNSLCADTMDPYVSNCPSKLPPELQPIYTSLLNAMNDVQATEIECRGDGNEDKKVNGRDLFWWKFFSKIEDGTCESETPGQCDNNPPPYTSSWYDFNHNGYTDEKDLDVIKQNLGTNCLAKKKD